MKKAISCLLAVAVLITLMATAGMSVLAMEGAGAAQSSYRAYGCDLSVWNGGAASIDFAAMKADGCEFAILRVGYGGTGFYEDKYFLEYYNEARAAGMDLGLYFYSYSTTYAGSQGNAQAVIDCIENYGMYFEYPLYIDLEESDQQALSASAKNQLVLGWCETMEAAGYFPGVYSNTSIFGDLYSSTKSNYDLWYAYVRRNGPGTQYSNSSYDYSASYSMWQYQWYGTDGSVPVYDGANCKDGNGDYMLDCNIAYKDYPTLMATYGYNNIEGGVGSTATKLGTYQVTASSLNVRAGIGTSYDVVGSLVSGDLVTVTELSEGWGKVTLADGTQGWCSITSYGDYIGMDILNTDITAPWGDVTITTNADRSVTFVNNGADQAALDMPMLTAVGTSTTPYLNISVSVAAGGFYFGLTEAGSGYFMMRESTSGDELVEASTATYMTGDEMLQISVKDWWTPDAGYRIDTLRLYLDAGAQVTVNYAYFADAANVVTSTAYNTRPYTVAEVRNETLMLPDTLAITDETKTGSYSYQNGMLTVVSGETDGYAVTFTINKAFEVDTLKRLLYSVAAEVRYDIELVLTTSDGDRTVSLVSDFWPDVCTALDGNYIPAAEQSAGLDLRNVFVYNNVMPADGISTIKTVTVKVGGEGKVIVNGIQIAENDALKLYNDGVSKSDHSPKTADPDTGILGDVDGSGDITTADARIVLQYTINSITLTDAQLALADYNQDGEVNTADARDILIATL